MLLAWVTFPAGGVYPWVWVPAACGVAVLAMVARPANARDERARFTDAALALSACALLLQLVPMPSALLHALDPNVTPLRASIWLQPAGLVTSPQWRPITIVPSHTLAAFSVFGASALLYWSCRQIYTREGAGRIVRAVAVIGLAASIAASSSARRVRSSCMESGARSMPALVRTVLS